jgi:ribosome recycling factor
VKELQDKLQKMTDNYIRDIEKLMDEKSKEIMKV